MRKRLIAAAYLAVAPWLASCGGPDADQGAHQDHGHARLQAPVAGEDVDHPQRIVSLDYCADQYVLKLADEEQILAISPDAVKDFSYMREAAAGVPTVPGSDGLVADVDAARACAERIGFR